MNTYNDPRFVPTREFECLLGIGKTTRCERSNPVHKKFDPDLPKPVSKGSRNLYWTPEIEEYQRILLARRNAALWRALNPNSPAEPDPSDHSNR